MAKPLVPNQTVNKWPRWNLNPGSLKYSVELTVQIFKIYKSGNIKFQVILPLRVQHQKNYLHP